MRHGTTPCIFDRIGHAALVLASLWPAGLAGAPVAYIPCQAANAVSVVDVAARRVVATIPVGRSPAGIAVAESAGKAYVTNADGESVSVIDLGTRRRTGA